MKSYDLVIGVLTHNRVTLLSRTLNSLMEKFGALNYINMKIILFDNGSDEITVEKNKEICSHYGIDFYGMDETLENAKDNQIKDKQIANGHYNLLSLMLKYNSDVYLVLEDDWECISKVNSDLFTSMINYLKNNDEIGQIRLRECQYDGTLTGCSYTNFVTKELINWDYNIKVGNHVIKKGNIHWVNNPSLISRKALEVVANKFNHEIECMETFNNYYPNNAQLVPGLFNHIGPFRKRDDLIEKGYVRDEK